MIVLYNWTPFTMLEWFDKDFNLVPRLKKAGYDGPIFNGREEGKTFVPFYSSQIIPVNDYGRS